MSAEYITQEALFSQRDITDSLKKESDEVQGVINLLLDKITRLEIKVNKLETKEK